ncbi:MDR family MFS transporter [Streptomyces sp. M41]|uniref:MDR family MFS transporter n=1 Tax=Streptomyces sp. M41 TaxID=3059412 RepID=UPI00374CE6E5
MRSPTAVARLQGLPKSFWVVFAGQFVNRIGNMVVPFLVLYLGQQGMSAGDAGLVLGAVGVGGLLSQPLGGVCTDRWGPRLTLVAGLWASSAAVALLGAARGLPAILAAAVLVGVVLDVYRPAAAAVVASAVSAADRPRAYSLIYWAVNLGVALGGLLAGVLTSHGYWTLFLVQSLATAAFGVVTAVLLPVDRPAPRPPRSGAAAPGIRITRDRLLLALTGLNLLNGLVSAQITVGLPLAIKDDGLGTGLYGSVFLVSGIIIGVTQPMLSAWLERYDRLVVLSVSWLVFGLGIAATALADSVTVYIVTVCVWTLGEIGAASFVGSLVADLAPDHAQGRYQATFGWSYSAAQFIGPPAGAYLYAALGAGALWWSCAALGVVGLVGGLALISPLRRRLTAVPEPLTLQKVD